MLIWAAETILVTAAMALMVEMLSPAVRLSPTNRHLLWLVVWVKFLTPSWSAWPWAFQLQRISAVVSHVTAQTLKHLPDQMNSTGLSADNLPGLVAAIVLCGGCAVI